MKVLDKSCSLGITSSCTLTVQAGFGFVGDRILNETVSGLVRFHLGRDIVLTCWVCEVNGVLS